MNRQWHRSIEVDLRRIDVRQRRACTQYTHQRDQRRRDLDETRDKNTGNASDNAPWNFVRPVPKALASKVNITRNAPTVKAQPRCSSTWGSAAGVRSEPRQSCRPAVRQPSLVRGGGAYRLPAFSLARLETNSRFRALHMPSANSRDLTTTLVSGLKKMIADGDLHHGARLPPERDLAKRFSVNRASVRQALKALEVMGVVRQRVGDGTYLTQDASTALSAPMEFLLLVDGITIGELYEARRIFEPELAARAARRHTAEELVQLEDSVAEMKCQFESGSLTGVAAGDQRFHRLIWEMAGNRVCLRMFVPLHRIMTNSFAVSWSLHDYAAAIASHSGIVEAVRSGDAEAARRSMSEHLDRAESVHLSAAKQAAARAN